MTGMCSGVRRALQMARAIEDASGTAIYGELAHNPDIQEEMRRRGFQILKEAERRKPFAALRVLITAHGISDSERARLRASGKTLIDATCPYVRWIHQTAQRLSASGYFVVMLGKRDHVEVRGVVEDLPAHAVVETMEDVASWSARKLGVICQSTLEPQQVQQLLSAIRARNRRKEIRFISTTCRETCKRQQALRELLGQVDALVVIGGRNSSNTLALVQMAASHRVPCLHIAAVDELPDLWPVHFERIGLAAGASTPDETIDAVHQKLLQLSQSPVSEFLSHAVSSN